MQNHHKGENVSQSLLSSLIKGYPPARGYSILSYPQKQMEFVHDDHHSSEANN